MVYSGQTWEDNNPAYPASAARMMVIEGALKDASAGAADPTTHQFESVVRSQTATNLGDPAQVEGAKLAAMYGTTVVGTGLEQTAAVNAALSASVATGATRLVRMVGSFVISAPLVIPANTCLDATGAYVSLAAGSNCNMIQNAAVGTVLRVLDAAMTSGSGVLTSASALFTSTMVGRTVTVQGAGAATGAGLPTWRAWACIRSPRLVTLPSSPQP